MLLTVLRRSPRPAPPPSSRQAGDIWVDLVQRTAQVSGRPMSGGCVASFEPDPAAPAYLQTIWGVGYKLEPSART